MDPTILNLIRNKYVDVSGYLILNKDLPKNKNNMNMTAKPFKPYGVILEISIYFSIFLFFFYLSIMYNGHTQTPNNT